MPKRFMKEASTEDIKSIIDQCYGLGVIYFIITGGEPLLRKDLFEVLKHAKNKGLITQMNSNGFLLKDNVKKLKGLVDLLSISIDYPISSKHDELRGVKGAFNKAIEGIKAAKKIGIKVDIHATATKDSIYYIEDLALLSKKLDCILDISIVEPSPIDDYDTAEVKAFDKKELFAKTILNLKKRFNNIGTIKSYYKFHQKGGWGYKGIWCKIPKRYINIRPNGSIAFPCAFQWKKGFERPVDNNLKKLWYSKEFMYTRKKFNKCKDCTFMCAVLTSAAFTPRTFFEFLFKSIKYYKNSF